MTSLEPDRREIATCAYCPKMCSFACPVSGATRDEAHTPWGKMSAAHQQLTGARGLDESAGAAIFACTDCGQCTEHCRHSNPVGQVLMRARAEVVDEGEAPKSVDLLKERFARYGNPYGADLAAAGREISRETEGRPYFPGCCSLAREPSMVKAALDAAGGFGLRLSLAPASALCCGYPLWAAGLKAEFVAHARNFAERVEDAPELILGDPGCAVTLTRTYKEAGVELAPKVVLLIDLLAGRLEYAFGRGPLSMRVSYHDACKLGRELGCYDGPRRLLRAAVGEFHEPAQTRHECGCSGGGGLLPLTMPEAAREIASTQARAQGAPGLRVVTGCPTACRNFRKAGVDALDLFTVLARWMAFRDVEES